MALVSGLIGLSAVLAEYDREGAKPLWPGFEPASIPLEIFDGTRTWLVRHPNPPSEFAPQTGRKDVRFVEGRHETMRANTAAEVGGVPTATASLEKSSEPPRVLAALLLHEAFHVFQARRHPKWGANEAELFVYPVEDAEALALRRVESRALARALDAAAANTRERSAWASRAVEARRMRFARLPEGSSGYERGTELKEGLAQYIQTRALGKTSPPFPEAEFAADKVRDRAYASGSAMALLLDALDPRWKEAFEAGGREEPLDQVLARAVANVSPAALSAEEEREVGKRAAADVAAWSASRSSLREQFDAAPGWKLVVESASPLFPAGFDPLNVERLSAKDVLHTRFLKLANDTGSVEILDRRCLTEAAAAANHPLFEGVWRATVTGLAEEPRPETAGGLTRITIPGVTLSFRNATVSRAGKTITVVVPR